MHARKFTRVFLCKRGRRLSKSHSGAVLATCSCLLLATLGPFLLSLRQFCRICLEMGLDVGRLTKTGKKSCSWAAMCMQFI